MSCSTLQASPLHSSYSFQPLHRPLSSHLLFYVSILILSRLSTVFLRPLYISNLQELKHRASGNMDESFVNPGIYAKQPLHVTMHEKQLHTLAKAYENVNRRSAEDIKRIFSFQTKKQRSYRSNKKKKETWYYWPSDLIHKHPLGEKVGKKGKP
ncbi:Uncharacterized protein Rs2_11210 [Raphanus sativus]|uniref:Uncharacterized protein LOC130509236 n=1 Tax=Raphanus sativus TaxID=3726 RepID=A0A9W3DC34_RAPSA|nr:uncharacterized protein LOC130509236 [Raphanus sativus]KAJ4907552.1 Uncharacterized protein Rs2_11210 [Raphanus sativus]